MAMKWLRKHNKKILVVGGTLLMLAFLMPQQRGCSRGPKIPNRAVGQAFGQKIMLSEYYNDQVEYQILRDMGLGVPVPDPLDYVLLLREARQMHIPTGAEAVPDDLAQAIAQGNKVNNLSELAAKLSREQTRGGYQITEKLLRRAIGDFWAIIQTQQLVLGIPAEVEQGQGRRVRDFRSTLGLAQPSEKELELMFRDVREMLDIGYVSLPAWRYTARVQPASEAELIKQFETYKDQYPGTTDNEFGFGYKQPVLVRIEYVKAGIDKILAKLKDPAPTVLAEYYEENKEAYALPIEDKTDQEGESATDEVEKSEPVRQYKALEDVYEELKSKWREEKGRETALSMIAKARSVSLGHWGVLKKEHKDRALDSTELYPYAGEQGESLVSLLGLEFGVAPEYQQTGWLDPDETERLKGIGRSYAPSQPPYGFMALALSVRESIAYQDEQARNGQDFEVGQDCSFNLLDAQGNAYLFRVIGLNRQKVLSIEEMLADERVRSRVAGDLAHRQAYEYAKAQSQKLLELASQKGLEDGLKGLGEKGLEVRQTGLVARDSIKLSLQVVQMPLVDVQGISKGEVLLSWQHYGQPGASRRPIGILQITVKNTSESGRITAVGLNLPQELRMLCPELGNPYTMLGARNGGQAVPAGVEDFTTRYCVGGIEAGAAGNFDLLISAKEQELVNTANLNEGGIRTGESQTFIFMLDNASSRLSAISFARGRNFEAGEAGGEDFDLAARFETSGKDQLLRGVFPANRQIDFLKPCFALLSREGLVHEPSPPAIPSEERAVEDEAEQNGLEKPEVREPDLLIDSQTQRGPCVLIELPREGMCYVGQVQKHLPLSREEFQQSRAAVLNAVMSEKYTSAQRLWWNSNSIRQRTGYKAAGADQDNQEEEKKEQDEKTNSSPDE